MAVKKIGSVARRGSSLNLVPAEVVMNKIFMFRKQKVMLDRDLAELYGVETKVLLQAVKRNIERFPEDFMFRIDVKEFENLRSQFVTSRWGGRRYLPYAFTEQGVAMLSAVLRSKKAVQVNIAIMRVFVKLREFIATHKDLDYRLKGLERRMEKKDAEIKAVFEAIRKIMIVEEKPKPPIGFHSLKKKE